MPKHPPTAPVLLALAAALAAPVLPAAAQGTAPPPAGPSERLFLSFAEEASIAERQWWEGQFEFSDGDVIEATLVRGIVAIQPWTNVELGGRVGFGDTETAGGLPDGSGGTDFDLWGKYRLSRDQKGADFAVGGMVTVPTGDDTAGLGFDSFGVSVFGSANYPLDKVALGGHIGIRFNEDGQFLGLAQIDGQTSAMIGGSAVTPIAKGLNLVGEFDYESERFDGADDDLRLLGGVNWSVFRRGLVRAAVAVGLTDGAPDSQFIVGYAAQF